MTRCYFQGLLPSLAVFVSAAGCGNDHSPTVLNGIKPYLSLKVRVQDRACLLKATSLIQEGNFSEAKALLEAVNVPSTVRIAVRAEGDHADEMRGVIQRAVKTWNSALKGAVVLEIGSDIESADLSIYFESSVLETMTGFSVPGCSDIAISSDLSGAKFRKGMLKISNMLPMSQERHSMSSLSHLAVKGIGSYLGLEKSQNLTELMGPDTHDQFVSVDPSERDLETVFQLLRYERELASAAATNSNPTIDFPAIEFVTRIKDAGEVWRGHVSTIVFPFKNLGTAPLELEAKPVCGCALAKFDRVVQPGASGKIEVKFDSSGYTGDVSKLIEITSNSPGSNGLKLELRAHVKPTFLIVPQGMQMVTLPDSGPSTYEFEVKPQEPVPASIVEVQSSAKYISSQIIPIKSASGPIYRIRLRIGGEVPAGRTVQTLRVRTNSKKDSEFNIMLTLNKGICLVPPGIYFGYIKESNKDTVEKSIKVMRHRRPFKILRIDTGDPLLHANFSKNEDGTEYMILVSYGGGWKPGTNNRVLTIETDDPTQPQIKVQVQASVSGEPGVK